MLIFVMDRDAGRSLQLQRTIAEAVPDAEIRIDPGFEAGRNALERQEVPDAVFLDAGQWELEGRDFVRQAKLLRPAPRIILTADSDAYAKEAYALNVERYLIRPFSMERIREEVCLLSLPRVPDGEEKIQVCCFGYFAAFWQGRPLIFKRKKTMELFAFLVDRRGAGCSTEEAIDILYEDIDPEKMKQAKQNFRNLVFDLKAALTRIGQQKVLIRTRSNIAICPELLDCDYYRLEDGDPDVRSLFRGAYMEQYTWAESTKGRLIFYGRGRSEKEEAFRVGNGAGESALYGGHRGGRLEDIQLSE